MWVSAWCALVLTMSVSMNASAVVISDCAAAYNSTSPLIIQGGLQYQFENCTQPLYFSSITNITDAVIQVVNSTIGATILLQPPLDNVSLSLLQNSVSGVQSFSAVTVLASALPSPHFTNVSIVIEKAALTYPVVAPWPTLVLFPPGLTCSGCTLVLADITVTQGNEYFLNIQSNFTDSSTIWLRRLKWQSASRANFLNPCVYVTLLTGGSRMVVSDAVVVGTYDAWLNTDVVTSGSRIALEVVTSTSISSILLMQGTIMNGVISLVNVTDVSSFQVILIYGAAVTELHLVIIDCHFSTSNHVPVAFMNNPGMSNVLVLGQRMECTANICISVSGSIGLNNMTFVLQDIAFSGENRVLDMFDNDWNGLTVTADNVTSLSCSAPAPWFRCSGTGVSTSVLLQNSITSALALYVSPSLNDIDITIVNTTWCVAPQSFEMGVLISTFSNVPIPTTISNVIVRIHNCTVSTLSDFAVVNVVATVVWNVSLVLTQLDTSSWMPVDANGDAQVAICVYANGSLPNASHSAAITAVDSVIGGSVAMINIYPFVTSFANTVVFGGRGPACVLHYNSSSIAHTDTLGPLPWPPIDSLAPMVWTPSIRWGQMWIENVTTIGAALAVPVAVTFLVSMDKNVSSFLRLNLTLVIGKGSSSFDDNSNVLGAFQVQLFLFLLAVLPEATISGSDGLILFSVVDSLFALSSPQELSPSITVLIQGAVVHALASLAIVRSNTIAANASQVLAPLLLNISVGDTSYAGSLLFVESCNLTAISLSINIASSKWSIIDLLVGIQSITLDVNGATVLDIFVSNTTILSGAYSGAQSSLLTLLYIDGDHSLLPPPQNAAPTTFVSVNVSLRNVSIVYESPIIIVYAERVTPIWATAVMQQPLAIAVRFSESAFVPAATSGVFPSVGLINNSALVSTYFSVLQSIHVVIDDHSNVTTGSLLVIWSCDMIGDVRLSVRERSTTTATKFNAVIINSVLQRDVSAVLPTTPKSSWIFQVTESSVVTIQSSNCFAIVATSTATVLERFLMTITGASRVVILAPGSGWLLISSVTFTFATASGSPIWFVLNESSSMTVAGGTSASLVTATGSNLANVSMIIGSTLDGDISARTSISDFIFFSASRCLCVGFQWQLIVQRTVVHYNISGVPLSPPLMSFVSNDFPSLAALSPSFVLNIADDAVMNIVSSTGLLSIASSNGRSTSLVGVVIAVSNSAITNYEANLTAAGSSALFSIQGSSMNVSTTISITNSTIAIATSRLTSEGGSDLSGQCMVNILRETCHSPVAVSVMQSTISTAMTTPVPGALLTSTDALLQITEVSNNFCTIAVPAPLDIAVISFVASQFLLSSNAVVARNISFVALSLLPSSSTALPTFGNYSVVFDGGGVTNASVVTLVAVTNNLLQPTGFLRASVTLRCVEVLPRVVPSTALVFLNATSAPSVLVGFDAQPPIIFFHTLRSVPSTQCGSYSSVVTPSATTSLSLSTSRFILSPSTTHASSPTISRTASHTGETTTGALMKSTSPSRSRRSRSDSASLLASSLSNSGSLEWSISRSTMSTSASPAAMSLSASGGTSQTHQMTLSRRTTTFASAMATHSLAVSPSRTFSTSVLASSSATTSVSSTMSELVLQARAKVLPDPVRTSISATSVISGIVGTSFVSPSAGVSAYRGMTQLSLIDCPSQDDALSNFDGDWSLNPLMLTLNDDRLHVVRGAAVGDLIVTAGLYVLATMAVVIRRHFLGRTVVAGYWEAAGRLQVPGLLLIPYTMLLQPLVMMSIILLELGTAGDAVIGFAVLLVCVIVPMALCVYLMLCRFAAAAHPHHDDGDHSSSHRSPWNRGLQLMFHQSYHWRSLEHFPSFAQCFGFLFDPYVANRHWFFLIEMSCGIFAGVVGAAQVLGVSCMTLTGLFVALAALYVALLCFLRPLDSRMEALLAHINGWAALAASILALFDAAQTAAAWIITGQLWLSLAMILLAVAQYIHAKYLDGEHSKRRGERDTPASLEGDFSLEGAVLHDDIDDAGVVLHQLFPADPLDIQLLQSEEDSSQLPTTATDELKYRTLLMRWMPSDPAILERHKKLRTDLGKTR